jgi:glycine/D-amino acid oxidase-like deaminating enzyme/nitrite reductase/ring-hydroxylating ferredoxin subunit
MNTQSYWQSSADLPSFPMLNSDLEVDVVVVGAGLTGITAAWLLKQAGARVALLDRQGCAQADTGHTTAHLTYVTDKPIRELVRHFGRDGAKAFWEAGAAAIDQIFEITETTARDSEFRWVTGYLHGALDEPGPTDRKSLEEDAQLAGELGFQAEFIESVPFVNRPGVRFPSQAKFHPHKYLAALLRAIPGEGSHVFQNTEVAEFEDKPLAVHAGRHKVRCNYVIIATHNPLLGKTGMLKGTLFQSKLALYTSYVIGAQIRPGIVPEALFWDTADPYNYLRVDRHHGHDYAIFGGDDCKTGQEADAQLAFSRLVNRLKKLIPDANITHRWLGQVVETDDGLPFIGENEGRQFIATGFCGNGFTLGTLAAVMARDRYLGKRNPWFDLFAVDRKQFHGGAWRYVKENLDYPFYLLRDRLAGAEKGSLDDLKMGEGRILRVEGRKVAAYRDQAGKLFVHSPVCTHLGCIVRWNAADNTWDCPCHGSRFKADGTVFSGPAESPLKPIPEKER